MHASLAEVEQILDRFHALVADGFTASAELGCDLCAETQLHRFEFELAAACRRAGASDELAARAASDLARSVDRLRVRLQLDVTAAIDQDPAARSREEVEACYPGFRAIVAYRLAHPLEIAGIPILPRMLCETAHRETGIDIHPGATIGERFFIDHGTGVVIGETTIIGDQVTLYQGVTIGARNIPRDPEGRVQRGKKRHPSIGNNVVIYANATLLGGDTTIGDYCVIGAGVWLTESLESDTVVVQDRPRHLQKSRTRDRLASPDSSPPT